MTETRVGHCKADQTDVYVGRGRDGTDLASMAGPDQRGWLGNPYPLPEYTRQESIEKYRALFEFRLESERFREAIRDLAGQTLGCWCQRLDEDAPACHAEVIAEHADRLAEEVEA